MGPKRPGLDGDVHASQDTAQPGVQINQWLRHSRRAHHRQFPSPDFGPVQHQLKRVELHDSAGIDLRYALGRHVAQEVQGDVPVGRPVQLAGPGESPAASMVGNPTSYLIVGP